MHFAPGHLSVTLKEMAPFGAQCPSMISITYHVYLEQETNSRVLLS